MSKNLPWTFANIPDQTGKTALVTGGNSGLGYYACRAQAATGRCRLLVYPPLIAQYLSDFSLHSLTISADLSVLLYHMPRIKHTFAQRQPGDFILMIGGE